MASKADELYTAIFAKGDEIKKLKAQKVEKAVLQPHIAELLDLKAKIPTKYKQETGEEYVPGKNKASEVTATAESQSATNKQQKKQATWYPPPGVPSLIDFWDTYYPLRVYNSLTRTKVPFIPISGRRVLWYMCGPTVYDKSHLGHARTYVWFDVMRRLMEDYFRYDVALCMNITDIDDKIIIRSMENGWKEAHPGKELPKAKEEAQKVVMDWAHQQPAEENMSRTLGLSSFFENDFFEDMKSLGVRKPDILTRVSEYVPEVCRYVQKIIDNGFAYESNGSVYFDVSRFQSSGHSYGKLVPENVGSAELLAEGEGSLAVSAGQADKRNPSDFALWKASKPGEPWWESPWGPGRPGWHIECSVMASSALQEYADGVIDIHTGGIDLRFPHHDNELAQTEAYYDFRQWVNYFIHTGHLNIEGLKMSKSLKNFLTIKEALELNNARQIRFLFLLHKYNAPMDYSQNTMDQAVNTLRLFAEFFANVKAKLREFAPDAPEKLELSGRELTQYLTEAKQKVRAALSDDFDTPAAIAELLELVKKCNRYLATGDVVVPSLVRSIAEFVTEIFKCFGMIPKGADIGFPVSEEEGTGGSREETLAPVLDILSKFRDNIRAALTMWREGDVSSLLKLCDSIRDEDLIPLGVRLEDKGDGASVWKLEDPKVLLMEREQKLAEKTRKEELKRQKEEERARKEAEEREKAKTKPQDMFRSETTKYSKFDDEGIPTHDAAGEPLSKGQIKKLKKDQEKQAKLYQKYNAA